jgi:hypothetical protein
MMKTFVALLGLTVSMAALTAPALAQDYLGPFLDAQRADNLRRHQQRIRAERLGISPDAPDAAAADADAAALAAPAVAAAGSLFRVGRTGINCYREPCPHRGVTPVSSADQSAPAQPIWWGDTPPTILGDVEDYRVIEAAWDDFRCVLVEGEFDGEMLTVRRVAGEC